MDYKFIECNSKEFSVDCIKCRAFVGFCALRLVNRDLNKRLEEFQSKYGYGFQVNIPVDSTVIRENNTL